LTSIPFSISCTFFSQDISLRNNEKKALKALNKKYKNSTVVRYPVMTQKSGVIKTPAEKVAVLLQATFGNLEINTMFRTSMTSILQSAARVCSFLLEIVLSQEPSRMQAETLISCVQVAASIEQKIWWDSKHLSRQIESIGPVKADKLVAAGLTSYARLAESTSARLEDILAQRPPAGLKMKQIIAKWPKMSADISFNADASNATVTVSIDNPDTCDAVYRDHWVLIISLANDKSKGESTECHKLTPARQRFPMRFHLPTGGVFKTINVYFGSTTLVRACFVFCYPVAACYHATARPCVSPLNILP